ncbi:DUF1684 domain-containing protein [Maribacter sp. 2307ULW6-5]|uniref:DUF1684 domain-containing protein n=1 Tax=Maribacter sp. 2307ULW6-5 TaxID=3386275 RepID=UPI0039BC7B96
MRILYLVFVLMLMFGCREKKKYHDPKADLIQVEDETLASIIQWQRDKDEEFRNPETSPLPDRFRKDFEGLDFFAPDTNYVVTAQFERTPDALPFLMPTNTERESEEVLYGRAHFTLNGRDFTLEVYQTPELMEQPKFRDHLFLPFTDLTNGRQTYGGGRYLDLKIPDGNTIQLDFNKAYAPYCAYNRKYSCPLVPKVNHLDTEVLAGIKEYEKIKY